MDIYELVNKYIEAGYSEEDAIPQDEFVEQNTDEKPYWIYNPDDKYHALFSKKGVIWKTNVIGCDSGYYYEYYKSRNDCEFRKVDARAFVKAREMRLVFA